jgi:hypothetical protein
MGKLRGPSSERQGTELGTRTKTKTKGAQNLVIRSPYIYTCPRHKWLRKPHWSGTVTKEGTKGKWKPRNNVEMMNNVK